MEKLIITTEDQLKQLLKESLTEFMNPANKNDSEILGDFIDQKQAAQFLGRKGTWFYNMKKSGRLPFSKVGSKTFYSKADLLKILNKNKE